MSKLAFDIKVEVKAKGGFQISREKLLVQIELQKAKPPSPERDEMLAHMESMLSSLESE